VSQIWSLRLILVMMRTMVVRYGDLDEELYSFSRNEEIPVGARPSNLRV